MCTCDFVRYLNTLHNYNAQNSNVFGEKNIESKFYDKLMVDIPICDYIVSKLTTEKPHIMVLTGHAGDGKTSLMYQILSRLNKTFPSQQKEFTIDLDNGKKCLFIKDFSEFSDKEKEEKVTQLAKWQEMNNYAFLVANTGPLINFFPNIVESVSVKESQTKLIDILDSNTGEIVDYYGVKVCMINVVAVNNTFFAGEFIDKLIDDNNWKDCNNCGKNKYCHIINNVKHIKSNLERTKEFISNHYMYITEYGNRLTIRSMTQQLSFMITGGINCEYINNKVPSYILLSPNLFFGYRGTMVDIKSLNINSIKIANDMHYDKKRLRVEEALFISNSYQELFDAELEEIINSAQTDCMGLNELNNMIKRIYFFYNIQTDEEKVREDLEDIFSIQFQRFKELKFLDISPASKDFVLFRDAFSMLNIGKLSTHLNDIPITLNRDSGFIQNVQYIIGNLKKTKLTLVAEKSSHSNYLGAHGYNDLYIKVNNHKIDKIIDLPLMDYFSDLRNGIINTNIDAQLSKGLESINSALLSLVKEDDEENQISLLLTGSSNHFISLLLEDGKILDN